MSKILRISRLLFRNRFCIGWCTGVITMFIVIIISTYPKWYIPLSTTIIIISYLGFRHIAFKYFDN